MNKPPVEQMREALAELVACKDLKDEESRLRQRRLVAIQRNNAAHGRSRCDAR